MNLGSESVVLSAAGSLFHSLGANRTKSLGGVDRCPVVFSEGSVSIPVSADLSARRGTLVDRTSEPRRAFLCSILLKHSACWLTGHTATPLGLKVSLRGFQMSKWTHTGPLNVLMVSSFVIVTFS